MLRGYGFEESENDLRSVMVLFPILNYNNIENLTIAFGVMMSNLARPSE